METIQHRSYSDLILLPTFEERIEYLKLTGIVGEDTFGFDRYLNQRFYHSDEWDRVRNAVIIRDNGCDLGIQDREIFSKIIVHHMNPIIKKDFSEDFKILLDPEFLISTSLSTHNYIHYGHEEQLAPSSFKERSPYDTCPWKRGELL